MRSLAVLALACVAACGGVTDDGTSGTRTATGSVDAGPLPAQADSAPEAAPAPTQPAGGGLLVGCAPGQVFPCLCEGGLGVLTCGDNYRDLGTCDCSRPLPDGSSAQCEAFLRDNQHCTDSAACLCEACPVTLAECLLSGATCSMDGSLATFPTPEVARLEDCVMRSGCGC